MRHEKLVNLQSGLKSNSGGKKMEITDVGLDLGNTCVKLCIEIDGKLLCISIPSLYAFDKPVIVGKSGQEIKAKVFSLLFKLSEDADDTVLWFGQDVLASQNTIHKLKEAKYNPSHISFLFRAVLYAWSKKYKVDIASLGKLNIVASMPPGLYQKSNLRTQAEKAYGDAFNRGQSHVKIRDGKDTVQIVSQFQSLVREAVIFGKDIPRKNEGVLVYDMGGETNDLALFNGSIEPVWSKSLHTGLLHTFTAIDPANPGMAELKVLNGKNNLPVALISHYNQAENTILLVKSHFRIDKLYLIGGGVSLMSKLVRSSFTNLAKKVVFKDEYATVRANWKEASK